MSIMLQPEFNSDEIFLEQVASFIQREEMLYLGTDKTVLVDNLGVPIFDIKEAQYTPISRVYFDAAYTYLSKSAKVIHRLMKIISEKGV